MVEPYHVAGGWQGLTKVPRPKDPAAIIQRAMIKQCSSAISQLGDFAAMLLRRELRWISAVVLTMRGRLSDDLETILASHAHIHIAEAEAIRSATRAALDVLKIVFVEQDEKSILPEACRHLDYSLESCDHYMKSMKPPTARSWRKEERTIALGA